MVRRTLIAALVVTALLAGCDKAQLVEIERPPIPLGEGAQVPLPPPVETDGDDALPRVWVLRDIRLRQAATGEWRDLGFNLDNRCSAPPEIGEDMPDAGRYAGWDIECSPVNMGDLPALDGNDCRDNNFGQFVSLGFEAFPYDVEEEVNDNLLIGEFALMVRVFGYDGTDNDPLVTAEIVQSAAGVPEGGEAGDPLAWDGTDTFFPVQGAFDTTGRAVIFDRAAYVRDGLLVTRIPPGASFTFGGTNITLGLRLTQATLTGRIEGDCLEDVVLSARWGVDNIIEELDALGVCVEDTLRAPAIAVVRGAADLLANPEATPGGLVPCDAISVAIGLTGYPGRWGKPVRPADVRPNLCDRPGAPDAGSGIGGDGGPAPDASLDAGV